MAEHSATPRVFLPLMRTTQALLESRLLEAVLGDGADGDLVTRLIRHVQPASRSKDVPTLLVALHVLVLLLPRAAGAARTDVLRTVVLLLGHRFPKVRKAAADALYVHLITYSDPGELTPLLAADAPPPGAPSPDAAPPAEPPAEPPMEAGEARLELVMGVLLETAWLDALDAHAKPARAKVLAAYGLPPPRVAAAGRVDKPKRAEEDTYKELVGEVGLRAADGCEPESGGAETSPNIFILFRTAASGGKEVQTVPYGGRGSRVSSRSVFELRATHG